MNFFKPLSRFYFSGGENIKKFITEELSRYSPNEKDSMIYATDNMILIGKIAGFLGDDKFAELANDFFSDDPLHSSIIWRIHILSWAIESCKNLEGDFIEFGCYDAKVAEFLINYNNIKNFKKSFYLYDAFENPPTTKGEKHSANLFSEVSDRLKKYDFVKIIPGLLPDTFKNNIPKKISFVHLDLNSADTELSLIKLFFERLVSGGIIILDDYGTMFYEEQYYKEKDFFSNLGYSVLELPTGGGMVIKR